jgi:hypothetical protein
LGLGAGRLLADGTGHIGPVRNLDHGRGYPVDVSGVVGSAGAELPAGRMPGQLGDQLGGLTLRRVSLELGGGFPAAIGDEKAFPIEDMKDFPSFVRNLFHRNGVTQPVRVIFEPGKSIVINAGIGLIKVIARKRLGMEKRMVIVDGSTYNFVPDALIQTSLKYDLLPASKMDTPRSQNVTIGGNTCDCWDLMIHGLQIPKLRAGDLVAIMDVGAYAQVMASNFNTIKRASMVMLHPDGTTKLIRRRDRYSEMFAPELDVLKVAAPDELEKYHNMYRVNIDKIWKDKRKSVSGKNGK